jgi:hypothetical protein
MTEREARLVAATQAFIAATRGGVLEQNYLWTDLRDALADYPIQVVVSKTQAGDDPDGRRFAR